MKKNLNLCAEMRITDRSARSLKSYFADVRDIPTIGEDEKQTLFRALTIAGKTKEKACQRLAEGNLRLVITLAKQHYCEKLCLEDLIQEGNIGLVKAARNYDPSRGNAFSSNASRWIDGHIINAIHEYGTMVSSSGRAWNLAARYHKYAEQQLKRNGIAVSAEEFAASFGIDSHTLTCALAMEMPAKSIDLTPANAEIAACRCDAEDDVEHENLRELLESQLRAVLNATELDVLLDSFGMRGHEYKIEELCHKYGLSRSKIFRLRTSAISKIQRHSASSTIRKTLKRLVSKS